MKRAVLPRRQRPADKAKNLSGSEMNGISRRSFVAMAFAGTALAGCANPVGSGNAAVIDARVDSALSFLYQNYPGTVDLGQRAAGILVMPVVT